MQPAIDTFPRAEHPSHAAVLASQKQSWDRFSTGWEKWDDFTMRFLEPQGAAILGALELPDGARVLDVATGTGDPGLSLAARRSDVQVTALDASEGMLRVARNKATERGLVNFDARAGDACALDFADASFDAVSCRLGFMFFPDLQRAAEEMARVLRPGGVVVATVWAEPALNPWISTFMGALGRHVEVPKPPPGAPGLFRCADPGHLGVLLERAGLTVAKSELLRGDMRCDSTEEYWQFMTDVVPPAVAALGGVSDDTVDAVRASVFEAVGGASLARERLAWAAWCVAARK